MIKFLLYVIVFLLCWPIALLVGLLWVVLLLFKALVWLMKPRGFNALSEER